jgi:hypothetical protein
MMNKPRQQFKGESLAHGPMDSMSGNVNEARARAKVYPAPVKVEEKDSSAVETVEAVDAQATE